MAAGQLPGLRHCPPAQPSPAVSNRPEGSTGQSPKGEPGPRQMQREVEEEKGWGGQGARQPRAAKAEGSPRIWRSISINY